jgi:hypothetical protein
MINRAGLDRLADLLGQMGPAWGVAGRGREAEQ